ncbi:MAG: selenide, water dikinase SelD [Gammaproteobacteria bacterium]|nr:selenide, water dikinase SelD [Gammaproteobacteria bacterium]NIR83190.1 selenide, water dikinase SelD [Gammaproteobacteria bacterium]NIR90998.1 selenide, water dikinase SelD [Gammaproteobacteria bacterium]NIU04355.1 selenide, water dikinase SelD [Gammaproteobacteria bacterium]NIV52578.1 selenide, water dikinase SelD [Gammaproteobacteria bacterium]
MQKSQGPVVKDLVLVGGGHSHVAVLRRFGMKRMPGVRLTLICRDAHTPYSGMLPGLVAGHYAFDDAHIDLEPLSRFAGARFYHAEVTGLDLHNRRVLCRGRPPVSYELLSINIGSTPRTGDVPGAEGAVVPVKPINRFIDHWQRMSERVLEHDGPVRIAAVGAGAGGVEILLAVQHRLRRMLAAEGRTAHHLEFHLFSKSEDILPTHNPPVRRRFGRVLRERGVHVHTACPVTEISRGRVRAPDGEHHFDEVLWVTPAGAAPWVRESGLRVNDDGFIEVNDALQSLSHPEVFAAGDIAHMVNHPRPKSGVFAVRQGKPLARNLRRALRGRPPRSFRPQREFLGLISTGDRYAVASRSFWSFEGRLVWRWKDWIDRRFMRKYNELPEMEEKAKSDIAPGLADAEVIKEISAIAMRCGGCGAKVGSSVLDRALAQMRSAARDDILVGLDAPDDAAVVRVPEGRVMVHTVDYFRAFVDDPYVFGRVAANHSLGDIFAMAAEPQSALAVATLPHGLEHKVEEQLYQLMSGALEVLNDANTALVGGHTSEGAELALGFAVNGLADPARLLRKGGMRAGDRLILNKPLGTGTLFAADMRLKAKGRWIDDALACMVQSNRLAAHCIHDHGATACTDVTGFGLLGHLVEMTKPSEVDTDIELATLPLLDGALETVRMGIFSSLQPQNVRLRRAVRDIEEVSKDERYPLVFDPQTAGGLLASVPEPNAGDCVTELRRLGYTRAAVIGHVLPQSNRLEPIRLIR